MKCTAVFQGQKGIPLKRIHQHAPAPERALQYENAVAHYNSQAQGGAFPTAQKGGYHPQKAQYSANIHRAFAPLQHR